MIKKSLATLILDLDTIDIIGSIDVEIKGIVNDSREVKPGYLFVAIKGYSHDGHSFVAQAVRAGAIALVTEKHLPNIPVTQVVVNDARVAQAFLACGFYGHPSRRLKIIGVTGTNGKTTTTFMIDSILQAAGKRTAVMGTLYVKVGDEIRATKNTTPDSLVCQSLLGEIVKQNIEYVTMEVSSHAMVMHRVLGMAFAVGALTNIGTDHLDLHQTMEGYIKSKQAFLHMIPKLGHVVVNMDDEKAKSVYQGSQAMLIGYAIESPDAHVCWRGMEDEVALVEIKKPFYNLAGRRISTGMLRFKFRVPGRHNMYNALLAIAASLALGIDVRHVEEGLSAYRGIFRRYEVIYQGDIRVIDDATHNPHNLEAVLNTVKGENPQGVVLVYAIRGNRGLDINQALAHTLRHWYHRIKFKKLIITNCQDTAGPLDRVLPQEESIFRQALDKLSSSDVAFVPHLRNAVREAIKVAKTGDTLLLCGAHPMDNVSQLFSEEYGEELSILPRPPAFGVLNDEQQAPWF